MMKIGIKLRLNLILCIKSNKRAKTKINKIVCKLNKKCCPKWKAIFLMKNTATPYNTDTLRSLLKETFFLFMSFRVKICNNKASGIDSKITTYQGMGNI